MSKLWDRLLLFVTVSDAAPGGAIEDRTPVDPVEQAVVEFQTGGDREGSFRRLVDASYGEIRGFLARRVSSPDVALELTQETFLAIYTGLDRFRRQASFRTWAFRIAHIAYLKWLQRQKMQPEVRLAAEPGSRFGSDDGERVVVCDETPLAELLDKEEAQRRSTLLEALAAAIDELPEQEGRCVVLRVYHDLKIRQIADFLGLQVGTVKAHLHHARLKLRDRLATSVEDLGF